MTDEPRTGDEWRDQKGRTWRLIASGQMFAKTTGAPLSEDEADRRLHNRALELAAEHDGRDVLMLYRPNSGAWRAWLLVEGKVEAKGERIILAPPPSPRVILGGVDITGLVMNASDLAAAFGEVVRRQVEINAYYPLHRPTRCAGVKANGCPCGYRVKPPRTYCKRHDPAEWEVDELTGWPVAPANQVRERDR